MSKLGIGTEIMDVIVFTWIDSRFARCNFSISIDGKNVDWVHPTSAETEGDTEFADVPEGYIST